MMPEDVTLSSSIDVVQPVKVDGPERVEEEEATLNEIVTEQSPEDLTTEMLSLEKLFSTTFKNDVLVTEQPPPPVAPKRRRKVSTSYVLNYRPPPKIYTTTEEPLAAAVNVEKNELAPKSERTVVDTLPEV